MYKIVYTKQAVKDIKNLKSVHLDEKAKILIDVIRENPFQNPPPFEALMGNLQGAYSRRINIQHRLVYEVCKNPVLMMRLSMREPSRLSECGRIMIKSDKP